MKSKMLMFITFLLYKPLLLKQHLAKKDCIRKNSTHKKRQKRGNTFILPLLLSKENYFSSLSFL